MTEETRGSVAAERQRVADGMVPESPGIGALVFASIRDAVIVTAADGTITLWNPGATAMFGLDAADAVGTNPIDLLRDAGVRDAEPLIEAARTDAAWTGDIVVPRTAGERIIDVVTYPIAGGPAEAHRVWFCFDVTAERRAAHADARLAALVEQAQDAIFTVDRDCIVHSWNRGAELLLGIPAAEAIGHASPFIVGEEEQASFRHRAFDLGLASADPDARLLAADGTEIPVSFQATPIREADGQIRRLSMIARDERPRARADRELRFRDAILERLEDAVVASDDSRVITFWSHGAERIFGVPAADAIGRPAEDVMPSRLLNTTHAEVARLLARGEVVRSDVEFRRADGTTFIGEVNGNVADTGSGGRLYLSVIRDVTDARRAAADSARLAAIVESAADIIFSADDTMVIRSWNPGAERILGWTAADIIGRTIATIVAPERLPVAMAMRDSVLRGAPSASGELVYVARDGARLPVWVSHTPVRDGSRVVAVSTIAQDLRGRKQAEEQVRQAQRLHAVGSLAAGIAHDFSNLVTTITGYASLLLADLADHEAGTANARHILDAAERAGELTRSLLALSAGESREPEVVEIDRLVTDITESLRRLLPDSVDLRIEARSGVKVLVDRTDLELVLVNLVTNAGEATPAGGRVEVVTTARSLDAAFAAAHLGVVPGPHAELVVRDTGRGLSPEDRAHLFEPFYTTKAGGGSGMGLATVLASVERAGGTIWPDPSPAVGTTFRIYLPAAPGTGTGPAPALRPARPKGGTERILVVEDDTQVRALATTILARAGYQLTVKGDPRRALEVDPATIDLLLSDVVMPHLDGPTLAVDLLGRRPDLPVVLMSGFADGAGPHDLAAITDRPLLAKPFGPDELLEAVRAALDARH